MYYSTLRFIIYMLLPAMLSASHKNSWENEAQRQQLRAISNQLFITYRVYSALNVAQLFVDSLKHLTHES